MLNTSVPDAESNYIQAERKKADYSSWQMYTLWNISIYTRKGLCLDRSFVAYRRGREEKEDMEKEVCVFICRFNKFCWHRITECLGLEGTSVGHPVQPPAKAGSPRADCTGPRPGGSWISPEKETPQTPWAACSRAPSPSEGRSSSSCSDGTS